MLAEILLFCTKFGLKAHIRKGVPIKPTQKAS